MATDEQCKIMDEFEEKHPDWEWHGFNKESIQYKKGNEFLFLDKNNRYGPYTKKEIFKFSQAIYTKNLGKFNDKEKMFVESCEKTILNMAENLYEDCFFRKL